jgi:hypothetical protein
MKILEGFNMPPKVKRAATDWSCLKCSVSLELATVKLTYLDETFAADTLACPSCQRVFVSETDAVGKMAPAEKMLEKTRLGLLLLTPHDFFPTLRA